MSQAEMPKKGPYVQEVEPGTYSWCACGKSKGQPFCDGSHRGSEFVPIRVKIEDVKKVAWCGCKQTKTAPYCDGSHRAIA